MALPSPFIEHAPDWLTQVRASPSWMWKSAFVVAACGFSTAVLPAILPLSHSSSRDALVYFGFPLGFDAVMLCILYSVLWGRYLDDLEMIRRAQYSVILSALILAVFLAPTRWVTSPPF